jgi:hypothetical protein
MLRWRFNLFPAYWCTGARVTYVADDVREVRIELPLSWRTRNYVGTIFGGSMYAAVDPIHMVMLLHNLEDDVRVWDKSARIRFLKPGRGTLHARFVLEDDELAAIRSALEEAPKVDRTYRVQLVDGGGDPHAEVEKVVHLRREGP